MHTVCIIQRRLTHYRVPLFQRLRDLLRENRIDLRLIVGVGTTAEASKNDSGNLHWAESIKTKYWANGRLCWQPLFNYLADTDLLILSQENKLLHNHLLMVMPRDFKLAFWGHGANLQGNNPNGFKERFKRYTTTWVDWWFAYTETSAVIVKRAGFPEKRVVVLNNAFDTRPLLQHFLSVTPIETQKLRFSLGLTSGPVGVFLGSLYADKHLDLLFAAAEAIRKEIPDFQLLVIGEGPESWKVKAWCDSHSWGHWAGARFGKDKAAYLSIAKLMLNPGALGLSILDAFVCCLPLVTMDCRIHGPEIAYLKNGYNGVITSDSLTAYVEKCLHLLRDQHAYISLLAGCAESAREYTLENMALRFANGIDRCLSSPRYNRQEK